MSGLLQRYFANTSQADLPYQELLPGSMSGFPVRIPRGQSIPLFTEEEYEQLEHRVEVHTRVFDLTIPEEQQAYTEIMSRIRNVRAMLYDRIPSIDPANNVMRVYLEWGEIYAEPAKLPGRSPQME